MQIRLPVPRPGVPGDLPRYPFDQLAVGDSFVVPFQRAGLLNVRDAVRRYGKRTGGARAFRVSPGEEGNAIVERIT